jgi:hydroxymethylbilane synthase
MKIATGARSSPLSIAQFEEVQALLPHLQLEPVFVGSPGDRDKRTSLRDLGKTDFFTRDLDEMLLSKQIRLAIHSAKDLPDPLPDGLTLAALTRGLDSRDSLVFREGESLHSLRAGARIATSCQRREEAVKQLRSDFVFIDLRGTIEERIAKLHVEADGVVVAEAALIRLKLTHLNRIFLPGETAPGQGKLALVTRSDDLELISELKCLAFST